MTYAKLYLVGSSKPYELDKETYDAVLNSLNKRFIVLPSGSVVMTASISNIDTEERKDEKAPKYDRRGLPPMSEAENWKYNNLDQAPDPKVLEQIRQAKVAFKRKQAGEE